MPPKPPLRRFILLVLLPAIATCVALVQVAGQARDARRDAMLSRVGGMLAIAAQSELAEAWTVLEGEAATVATVDTSLVAVRRALAGDTIRSLGSDPRTAGEGVRASVLLVRADTLVSATAVVRSPTLAAVADVADLDAGLYLQGVLLQASRGPAATTLPARLDADPGWDDAERVWVSPATASTGAAAAELVVAVRHTVRCRPVASVGTVMASTGLLLLGLVLVASAGTGTAPTTSRHGAEDPARSGRIVAGVSLVALATGVVAGWVAVGEARVATVEGARELELVGALVEARGLLDDPVGAQRWAGSPVYRAAADSLMAAPGEPPPAFVASLPSPPPGRPASGTAVGGVRWRVVASGNGRTILLAAPVETPPLLPLALGGTLIVLLGSVAVARVASVQDVLAR
jgi:hypothetical protein